MVYIFFANINVFKNETDYASAYNQVNEIRRKKVDKNKNQLDKQRSLLAGYLLKYAIIKRGIDYDTCEFVVDESGYEHVLNRDDLFISLSHEGDVCVCAFADAVDGVDVECSSRFENMNKERISKRIMRSEELFIYDSYKSDNRIAFLSKLWTRKEAFSKVCKKGLSMDFKKIDTLDECKFRTFSVYNDYWISVSSAKKIDDDSLKIFDVTADLEAYNA